MNLLINNAVMMHSMPRTMVEYPSVTRGDVCAFIDFNPWWAATPSTTDTRRRTLTKN